MRVKQISVSNLYGVFDHVIPLHLDERMTIIHGPNGFGKTALLRMLNGFFSSRYSELRTIPFSTFQIDIEGGDSIKISKTANQLLLGQEEATPSLSLKIEYTKVGSKPREFTSEVSKHSENLNFPLSVLEQQIPELVRTSGLNWLYMPTDERLTLEDVFERFGDYLPTRLTQRQKEPEWLISLKASLNVRFIESQRLLTLSPKRRTREYDRTSSMVPAVVTDSEELAQKIQANLAEYATLSQSLDRTFPARLVEQIQSAKLNPNVDLTSDELRKRLNALEEKRSQLQAAGLLDKEEDVQFQVPDQLEETSVLSIYVQDVEKKLSVFEKVAAKIDLLKKIINERFDYKELTISKDKGFTFSVKDRKPLPPVSLSSGEQHELVLLYELLFRIDAGSLILVDEPEISLHVAWQEEFLKDLREIIKLSSLDVIIATHSPQIIFDRWDLTVELKAPELANETIH